jgi:Tol biopolymer transport system component
MSPEQARGRPVDKRTDIFAFGCVLFELLTGKRTFGGEDVSLTLAEVIKSEPDWATLPPLPPTVLMCLKRCLIKDPRLRLRDIGEMRLALSDAFDIRTFVGAAPTTSASRRTPWQWVLPTALLSALIGAALVLGLHRPPQAPPPPLPEVIRFDIHAPVGNRIPPGVPAISPDGHKVAYAMVGADRIPHLYVHDLATGQARLLTGTDNAVHPFWSPDGRSLAFASERTLKRVDIAGGPVRDLAEVSGPWHGTWGKSGDLLFNAFGIKRISAEGGELTPAVRLDEKAGETASAFPAFLPDGNRYVVRIDRDGRSALQLASLGSTERTPILDDILSAPLIATTPHGETYILYLRDEALMAQAFDDGAGKPQGTARVLIEGIGRVANPPNMPTAGVSPAGILAYQSGGNFTSMVLTWVNQAGKAAGEVPLEVTGQNPTLSPDGRFLAIDVTSAGNRDVWVADVARGVTSRITHSGGIDRSATWSPDGRRIAFWRAKKIYVTNADGGGDATVLADVDGTPQSWSPDGKYLLYRKDQSLYLWPFSGGAPIPVGTRVGSSQFGQFSPDSRAIAFTSNESGRDEVYVQLIPPASGPVRVSKNGGRQSRWGRTSSEMFFLSADRMMTAVTLHLGSTVSLDTPKKLFPVELGAVFSNMRFDLDVTRQRFLVPRIAGESIPDVPITVVLNWWTELVKKPN